MSFVPDTMLVHEVVASPNFGERAQNRPPDMVVIHYTGMPTAQAALDRLVSPLHQVSCHYVVTEEGRIIQMVPEKLRAWHAGEGSWNGEEDINSSSIGIEIVNPGHDAGYPDFPKRQIAAVTALCRSILRRRVIRADHRSGCSGLRPGNQASGLNSSPVGTFGVKNVDFGGMFTPAVAISRMCSTGIGERKNPASYVPPVTSAIASSSLRE